MEDDSIVAAGYDDTVHPYRISYTRAGKDTAGALESPAGGCHPVSVAEK